MQEGPELVRAALETDIVHAPFKLTDCPLRNDRRFILAVVGRAIACLGYVGEEWLDDDEVLDVAVGTDPLALKYASARLQGKLDLVVGAVIGNSAVLQFVSKDVMTDQDWNVDIAMAALRNKAVAFRLMPSTLRCDHRCVVIAIGLWPSIFREQHRALKMMPAQDRAYCEDMRWLKEKYRYQLAYPKRTIHI